MNRQRTVTFIEDKNSIIGAWDIKCEACPLLAHLKALNEPPRPCVSGISTGMQGAIPLKQCEFMRKDSLQDTIGILTLICTYEEATHDA